MVSGGLYSDLLSVSLRLLSERKPLVFTITNYVTILDVAQAIRDSGALPAMWFEKEAAVELTRIASALYLNMGTISDSTYESMVACGKEANKRGIPVVVDIVAAGAAPYITKKCNEILSDVKVSVVKGNRGEIATLCGGEAEVRGVESISHSEGLESLMREYAKARNIVLVASGESDIVTDGERTFFVRNGVPELGLIVGSGCVSTALIAAFASVQDDKDYALSSALAMAYFGIAGERAAEVSKLTGTFKVALFDQLYKIAQAKDCVGVKIDQS